MIVIGQIKNWFKTKPMMNSVFQEFIIYKKNRGRKAPVFFIFIAAKRLQTA